MITIIELSDCSEQNAFICLRLAYSSWRIQRQTMRFDSQKFDTGCKGRRRQFLAAAGGAALGFLSGCAGNLGQQGAETTSVDYPSQDVRLVVPTNPGGGTDAYGRITKPYWEEELDTTMKVENIPGAGMIVGTGEAYSAESDGHTMVTAEVYNLINGQIGTNVAYDLEKMSHIGVVSQEPNAFVIMDQAKIETWSDFKEKATEINWATNGRGSNVHINPILLAEMTGEYSSDELNFVHYEGTGETLAGLERGDALGFGVGTLTSAIKVVKALENASLFAVFARKEDHGALLENAGVETNYWLSDLDDEQISDIEKYANLTVFRRFFSGPPEVPEPILNIQREAFLNFVKSEEFQSEAKEKGRPALNPAGHEVVENTVKETFAEFRGSRVEEIIKNAFE